MTKIDMTNINDGYVLDTWIDKVLEANNKNEVKLIETKFKNMLSNANKGHLEQDLERDNDFIPKM